MRSADAARRATLYSPDRRSLITLVAEFTTGMPDSSSPQNIGFFVAGRMATALAKGLIQSRFTTADRIVASDVEPQARAHFQSETGAATTAANSDLVFRSNVVVLAVKPQSMASVLQE